MLSLISKYELKKYLGNRSNIIWNIIFPLAYFTFFYFALSNIASDDANVLPTLHVSIVEGEKGDQLVDFFDQLDSVEGDYDEEGVLTAKSDLPEEGFILYKRGESLEVAKENLINNRLDAVIIPGEEVEFQTSLGVSMTPTIMKQVLQGFERVQKLTDSMEKGFREGNIPLVQLSEQEIEDLKASAFEGINTDGRKEGINMERLYFYASLAYLSFFPINSGLEAVSSTEANQSKQAMRKALSPISKRKRFFGAFLPPLLVHVLLIVLTYGYTQLLGVDYSGHHPEIILLIILGTCAALTTGTLIGSLFAGKEGLKMGVSIGLPLVFAMISGMMSVEMHNSIMQSMPWLHNYNPLGRVSNGLYILTAEGASTRYFDQITGLIVYVVGALVLTLVFLRRDNYESL